MSKCVGCYGIFSEKLKIMDRNLVKYIVEEQQKEIEEKQKVIEKQKNIIEENEKIK